MVVDGNLGIGCIFDQAPLLAIPFSKDTTVRICQLEKDFHGSHVLIAFKFNVIENQIYQGDIQIVDSSSTYI